MREKTIIPTTLLHWPRVADLLPDQKLIVLRLWSAPWLSGIGVGQLPLSAEAATLSLSAAALDDALREFERRELIVRDEETGEIFIRDWFRFHIFKGRAVDIAKVELTKIRSAKIRAAVQKLAPETLFSDKSTTSLPNHNHNHNHNHHPLPPPPKPKRKSEGEGEVGSGVVVVDELEEIVEAAAWAAAEVKSPAAFRRAVRERILREGASNDDTATVKLWREEKARRVEAERVEIERKERGAEEAARPKQGPPGGFKAIRQAAGLT